MTSFPISKPLFSARRSWRHLEHEDKYCNRWFCHCQATNIHLSWPFQNLCVNLGIWWFQLRKINECAFVNESSKVGSCATQSLRNFCLCCVVLFLLYRAMPSTLQVLAVLRWLHAAGPLTWTMGLSCQWIRSCVIQKAESVSGKKRCSSAERSLQMDHSPPVLRGTGRSSWWKGIRHQHCWSLASWVPFIIAETWFAKSLSSFYNSVKDLHLSISWILKEGRVKIPHRWSKKETK